jgi:C-terminal processing protease CtpA/Prc
MFSDDPQDDPLTVYNSFWAALDRDYAGFYTKQNYDWEALRALHYQEIINAPSEETLLLACTDIITHINDGHMILYTSTTQVTVIPDNQKIPFDTSIIRSKYLHSEYWNNVRSICTGILQNNIGYMRVDFFGGEGWERDFSTELNRLSLCKNLIIDLRNNGGGSYANGEALLSEFIDRPVKCGREIRPMGPGNDPFHKELWIQPSAGAPRQHRIILLINEGSSSTTDIVIAAFQAYTNVYTIGKPTQADLIGNNVTRELPNGWVLRLGTINNLLINDAVIDGTILPVDLDIDNTMERIKNGIDDQLNAAIDWFNTPQ